MRATPSRWAASPLLLLLLLLLLLGPAMALGPAQTVFAACDQLTYDDLPVNTQYTAGMSFVTGGTTVNVREYFFTPGPCAPPTIATFARVMTSGGCITNNGIFLVNVNLDFVFGGTVTDVVIPYVELGGSVNLAINGDCRVTQNYVDFDGTVLGGVAIEVFHNGQPGQGCGVIVLAGDVDELRLGGQEVIHDKLSFCRECASPDLALRAGFDDLPLGGNYTVGTGFTSGQADFAMRPFFSPPDPACAIPFGNGFSTVVASDFACASGQELLVNNVNVAIDFNGRIESLAIAYGELGGNVNLTINGDCRNVPNFADLNGALVGGAEVRVVDFAAPGQGCGVLYASGPIDEFMLGGQELWIDQVRACRREGLAVDEPAGSSPPIGAILEQSVPNPWSAATAIGFTLAAPARTQLAIYDVGGHLVRTLLDASLDSGRHEAAWDGIDDRGSRVASGIYLYRLTTSEVALTRRMILLH
jgi:FlgD Ig-like domain